MGILSAFRFAFQNLFFSPILYGVIASLAVFSSVWDRGDRLKDQLTDRFRSQEENFDFIIVGGGSAGAVLANRLSQYHTVLLLEAGGETHPFQAIPGLSIFIPKNPGTDWMHKSVPQTKSCLACRHKKYVLSQGRNLGGSGNINYMMHLRGNPLDFNNWATITGDQTWGYDGVLPYFIQSEHFVGETTDKTAHGYGGPLQIQIPDCIGLANEWNSAGEEMGYPHIDLNGRHTEGFDTVFYPIKHGVRQATYRAFIQPVRNRPSLLIRKFAHVNKILIREATNEAFGVEYDRHGHRKHAFANKEVIVSAGTLQTPKLLVLSGIGQLDHLTALRVPVRSVLPVGKNLQDHIGTLLGPFYINKPRTISFDRDIDRQSFVTFTTTGKGPLSTTGFQATAVFTSSIAKAQGQGGWPDIQITLFGLTPHRMFYSDIGHAFGIREDILHRYYGDVNGKENAFFIMVSLTRPISKGDYCVSRNDPYKPPVIDPNYLMDPEGQDIRVLIEGVHRALYLAENTTAFRSLETLYSPKCFPGCEKVPFRSNAYWECYVRSFSVAMNNHVGTCPMGKLGSPYAVVDPELKVQGIKALRVVDASVFPTIVGVPTQAATIMVAEKASSLILNTWKHDAKTLYGPPGKKPGPPLSHYGPPGPNSQYGPPGKLPGPPIQQYGPPNPNAQYGPPGRAPPVPSGGGDAFSNYDSFSLIRDQLNPPPSGGSSPPPTSLIPLPPDPQLWSTAAPFPDSGPTKPGPPYLSGIDSTSPPLLTPEPSQLLVPPGQFSPTPKPAYATSFATSNIDFTGSIISTTPNYASSFNFDTSRSASENDRADTQGTYDNATNTNRQGKSFDRPVDPAPDGNQLGQGLDDEDLTLPTVTPSSTPTYFSTDTSTAYTPSDSPITQSESINQSEGFRVIRKRIRTTPRVVVHPRGHLGHQNVQRKAITKLNESIENLLLTTSSVRPVPKNVVKIRRRRPVPNLRKTTTTVPPITEDLLAEGLEERTTFYGGEYEYTTTGTPPTEIPELRSPAKKRFVRRMFARPLNFNGKKGLGERSFTNEYHTQASATQPITVTAPAELKEEITTTLTPPVLEDKEEQEPDKVQEEIDIELDVSTESPNEMGDSTTEENQLDEKIDAVDSVPIPPVVIFKNIELEDTEELSRKTRSNFANASKAKSGYYEYSVVDEEGRNPIMLVDLDPVPEIIAPKAVLHEPNTEGQPDMVAISMDENAKEVADNDDERETSLKDDTDTTFISSEYDDNDGVAEGEDENDPIFSIEDEVPNANITLHEEVVNKSSSNKLKTISQVDNNSTNNRTSNVKYTVVVSSSSSSSNSSSIVLSQNTKPVKSTTSPPASYEDDYGDDEVVSTTANVRVASSSTLNPRYSFRMRNGLIRVHS